MKTYNEMVESLQERRQQFEAQKKKRNKLIARMAASFGCVCLVALLGIGMWYGGVFESKPVQTLDDSVIPGMKDWYGPGETEQSNAFADIYFSIKMNELESAADGAKLYFNEDIYLDSKYNMKQTTEYFGIDYTMLESAELTCTNKDEAWVMGMVTDKKTGKVAYDTAMLRFERDGKKIDLLASKIGAPYDCYYLFKTTDKSTLYTTDGDVISAIVGEHSTGCVVADFKIGDITYRGIFDEGFEEYDIWRVVNTIAQLDK